MVKGILRILMLEIPGCMTRTIFAGLRFSLKRSHTHQGCLRARCVCDVRWTVGRPGKPSSVGVYRSAPCFDSDDFIIFRKMSWHLFSKHGSK